MSETIRAFIATMSWNSRLPDGKVAQVASPLKFFGNIFLVQLPTPAFFLRAAADGRFSGSHAQGTRLPRAGHYPSIRYRQSPSLDLSLRFSLFPWWDHRRFRLRDPVRPARLPQLHPKCSRVYRLRDNRPL